MKPSARWRASSLGCILSGLGFHLAALAVLFGLWVAIGLPYGSYRLRAAERAWSAQFLGEQEFARRYPRREQSPAALRLDAAARRLGTVLAATPEDLAARRNYSTPELDRLGQFLTAVRESDSDAALPVPADVARIERAQGPQLDELEGVLLGDAKVEWRTPVRGELVISLLGLRRVHEALLVRSLRAGERGDRAARDRSLEAAWRFEESFRARPILLEHLLVFAAAASRNACLRRSLSPAPGWSERLRPAQPFSSIADTLQYEALSYGRGARHLIGYADVDGVMGGGDVPAVGPGAWLFRLLSAPLLRVDVAAAADLLRVETAALRGLDACRIESDEYSERVKARQPRWSVVARSFAVSLRAWWAARDAGLDDELTLAVLAQSAPGSPPDWSQVSTVCPGLTWRSAPGPGGGRRIHADGQHEPSLDDWGPGLRYSLSSR